MNTKKIALIALLAAGSAFAYACNGDNTQNDGGTDSSPPNDSGNPDVTKTDGGDGGTNFPAPPALKANQIDRMGRPAINTALNHVFDSDAGTAGVAKDSYNADKAIANWKATYSAQFMANLAVFDSLDSFIDGGAGSGCGNQAAINLTGTPYQALAGLAADDELYMNAGNAKCKQYLGVELAATNILPNTDCGGRTLPEDVMDLTYGAVSGVVSVDDAGVLNGVSDGVPATAAEVVAKTGGTTFPYLAAPQ